MRKRNRTGWHKVINGVNISAFLVVLFIALPLYWLIVSSFKTPAALGASPPQYCPNPSAAPTTRRPSSSTTSASTSVTR